MSTLRQRLARTGVVAALAIPALLVVGPAWGQGDIRIDRDVEYAVHGGIPLHLDVYRPPGDGPFPALVVIPGGRWAYIDRAKHADVPTYFAQHGIVAVAIEYRSALEFPYPAAVEDVTSAIEWVRVHAADYEIDSTQLGTAGVSAGGHLAALVAALGSGPTDRGTRVNVVASWSGPMNLEPLLASPDADTQEAVQRFLGCFDGDSCTRLAREASPINHVDATDPPMVLVNAFEETIPADQAKSMSEALSEAGVESDLRLVQGNHGAGYGGGTKVLDLVIPYIQAWLGGRPAPSSAPGSGAAGEGSGAGKGSDGEAASASPSAAGPMPKPTVSSAPGLENSSVAAVGVAVAMIGLVIVMIQLLVIARLRRRLTAVSAPSPPSDGMPSAERYGDRDAGAGGGVPAGAARAEGP